MRVNDTNTLRPMPEHGAKADITATAPLATRPAEAQGEFSDVFRTVLDGAAPAMAQAADASDPPHPMVPTRSPDTPPGRRDLQEILHTYQAFEEEIVTYRPNIGITPIDLPFSSSKEVTRTEATLLDRIQIRQGTNGLQEFAAISRNDPNDPGIVYRTAQEYFPELKENGKPDYTLQDGHNDAFRHAYWNALMTDRYGEDFAKSFATAHEGAHNNAGSREAMDLYNNELGRAIAVANPRASDADLARLVAAAVNDGQAMVISGGGTLAYSDQVAPGETGNAGGGAALPGRLTADPSADLNPNFW